MSLIGSAVYPVCCKVANDKVGVGWTVVISNVYLVPVAIYVAFHRPPNAIFDRVAWVAILGAAVMGALGLIAMLMSMRILPGWLVTALLATHPVLSMVCFRLLGEKINLQQVLGVAVIVVGVVLTVPRQGESNEGAFSVGVVHKQGPVRHQHEQQHARGAGGAQQD